MVHVTPTLNNGYSGEDATHRNSASDAGPWLKFLGEHRYTSRVTMMWLNLRCASSKPYIIIIISYVARISFHQECNEVNCTPGGSGLK